MNTSTSMQYLHRVGLVLAIFVVAACGDNQDDSGARRLLAQVRADDYRHWQRAPGYEERRSSSAPHSDKVDIFVNDIVAAALTTGDPLERWPVGSIVVKEGRADHGLELIALMEKRAAGWYWAEYDADGAPDYSGDPEVCTDCHRRGNDFIRAFTLP